MKPEAYLLTFEPRLPSLIRKDERTFPVHHSHLGQVLSEWIPSWNLTEIKPISAQYFANLLDLDRFF